MSLSAAQALSQVEQARHDLADLSLQEDSGEIDPETAAALRKVYLVELAEGERLLAAADPDPPSPAPQRRLGPVASAAAAVAVVVALIMSAAGFVAERAGGPLTGGFEGAARSGFDQISGDPAAPLQPGDFSDRALEAAVAANADDPQVAGMRLALAERYFSRGDYRSAFPHYQAVLEADPPAPAMVTATALTRIGWIVYDGNGESELALGLFDRALRLRPADPFVTYMKGRVTWCGLDRAGEAVELFGQVLASPEVGDESRARVEADLEAARRGESCS